MSVLAKNVLTLDHSTSLADSTRTAERSALVADVLRNQRGPAKSLTMKVRGESMLPALWPGDIVSVESCSIDDLQPGQVVLALRNGNLFLHRLLVRTSDGFQLRGDSMPAPDPTFPAEALLGRLVTDSGTKRTPSKFSVRTSRALGFLLCHCHPLRRIALAIHLRRTNPARLFSNSQSSAELETL